MEHRIRVLPLGRHVDPRIVGIDHDPRRSGGKARVFRTVPLHRRAGVVTALVGDAAQQLLRLAQSGLRQLAVSVQRLHVAVVLNAAEGTVGHAQFFALVDIGGPLVQMEHGGDALGAVGRLVPQPGDNARLVVVAQEQGVPRHLVQLILPFAHVLLEGRQGNPVQMPLSVGPGVQLHMLEGEDHVQLAPVGTGVPLCLADVDLGGLAHRHQIILRQHPPVHLPQVFMDARTVAAAAVLHGDAIGRPRLLRRVGHAVRLGDHGDHVHPEAVHPFFAPPRHHVKHLVPHLGVFPVEVGLFF